MHEPAELREPFSSEDERAGYIVQLLDNDRRLQELRVASLLENSELRKLSIWLDLSTGPHLSGDSPEARLLRWANLFSDDLDAIHRARNRIVHNTWISDIDLRSGVWLSQKLLEFITGTENGSQISGDRDT